MSGTDHVGDEEELPQPGRPLLPRRIRLAALLLAVLAVATLIAIRVWPRSPHQAAVPSATTSVASAVPPATPETTNTTRRWPTAPGACDEHDLPIVSSRPPAEHTGVTVLLGGNQLRTVDFDRGRVTAMAQARLHAGEFVIGLTTSSQTYAVTAVCPSPAAGRRLRLLRIGADGSVSAVTLPGSTDAVLADDTHVQALALPENPDPNASGYLMPLDGRRRVRLPAGFVPLRWIQPHGVIVGILIAQPDTGPNTPHSLLIIDATTGHVRAHLGTGWLIAASDGLVLWATGCDELSDKPCTLHSRSVTGGPTASYRLPRPAPESGGGVLSPDGRLLAFTLKRPAQDPRFEAQPAPPNDIAVLHLDTGRLEIVPGLEVPADWFPPPLGMAFSADGRWLMIAINAGPKIRLLAWRPGLAHPYESKPITGPVIADVPILVLPARTGH